MNELTNDDSIAYAVVDEALRTYPLSPVPPDFLPSVMARIQASNPLPHFRLNWLDYAVSLFVAGMTGLVILLLWSIPPQLAAQSQVQLWLWQQYFSATYLWFTLLGGLILFAVMIFSAALLFGRNYSSLG